MSTMVPFDFDTIRMVDKTYWYLPIIETEYINVYQHIFTKEDIWHEHDEISRLHYHNFYEIEIMFSGDAHHNDPLGSFDLNPLDYIVYEPNYAHDLSFGKSNMVFMVTIQFKKDLLDINTQFLLNSCKFPIHGQTTEAITEYFGKSLNIIDDVRKRECNNYLAYSITVKTLEVLIIDIISKTSQVTNTQINQKGYNEIIEAYNHIKDTFKQDLKVYDLAQSIGYTPNYFSHKFKEIIGMGVSECINEERLKYAYNKILFTTDSITSISKSSGFRDLKNFYRQFKRKYSITPAELRTRNKKWLYDERECPN